MGCNCKKKVNKVTSLGEDYTFEEIETAYSLMSTTINYSYEDQDFLYDLHNRIFVTNKQVNRNCGDCFRRVRINLENRYNYELERRRETEEQKTSGSTEGNNEGQENEVRSSTVSKRRTRKNTK